MTDVSERIARLAPDQRALLESMLENTGRAAPRAMVPRLTRNGEPATFPLSFAQQRLWFLDQLEPNSPLFNIFTAWRMRGALNVEALQQTLDTIVARHESLRTTFRSIDGNPIQVISAASRPALQVIDLSALAAADREAEAQRLACDGARRPFDLAQGPLLRTTLLRLAAAEHVLLLCMHHIVSDGWSFRVLLHEMAELYRAFCTGQSPGLPELPIQYADYAVWQRQWMQGDVLNQQLDYWKRQLGGDIPVLELRTDRTRPPLYSSRGSRISLQLPATLSKQLEKQGHAQRATIYMTLLAAWQALLHRYTAQTDIVVGSAIANRNRSEIEPLIGFFVNTQALRTDLSGDPTFCELLGRVREVALGAYAHQDLPFERLIEELQPARRTGRTPLFQTMFVLQNAPWDTLQLGELVLSRFDVESTTAQFDLTLALTGNGPAGLHGSLGYNSDLFDATTAARMAGHFQRLLEAIAADPDQRISRLPLLPEAERRQLLVDWPGTSTDYPRDACIHELFEAQAREQPEAAALITDHQRVTYQELNVRANRLAHHLRRLGVGPDSLVALCFERSVNAVVAMLGILKAGGAYVPLEPVYPRERLAFMIRDTRASVLVTEERWLETLSASAAQVLCVDRDRAVLDHESAENPRNRTTAENLAYVMYTSGSTGRPKGTCIIHRGVVRLVRGVNYAELGSRGVFLQFAPLSFDASTFEIWGALLNGAQLAIGPSRLSALEELGDTIRRHRVTTLWLTAPLFHEVVDNALDCFVEVKQLLAGGDVLSVAHVHKFLERYPACRLINGYGPTENTTFTCCYSITSGEQLAVEVPIGRPIANTRVYVLDGQRQPVPIGVPGELHIGGDGLARGYLNRPELTAEKFIAHPFIGTHIGGRQCASSGDGHESVPHGLRLYRTGDMARWRADGLIEFLGRIDSQVKIRGFRVEPGEVESVLNQHSAVRECAIIVREDSPGDKRLVAYVVGRNGEKPNVHALREFLLQRLPDFMIPAAIIGLDSLPVLPSGKLNRGALPAPDGQQSQLNHAYVGPRDAVEDRLCSIWRELLGVHQIGVHDNFFELGGHSLLAVRLFAQIEKGFGTKLPLTTLFQGGTIKRLAELLRQQAPTAGRSTLVAMQPNGSKRPLFLLHDMTGELLFYRDLVRHLGCDRPIYGLHGSPDSEPNAVPTLDDLAAWYVREILNVQPHGPYYLGGYSFGGKLAYQMARQLSATGEHVAMLAIIDTGPSIPNQNFIASAARTAAYSLANLPNWIRDDLLHSKPAEIVGSSRVDLQACKLEYSIVSPK